MKIFRMTLIAILLVAGSSMSARSAPSGSDDAAVLSAVLQDRCGAAKQDGEYLYQLGGPYWEGVISSETEVSSASSLSNEVSPTVIRSFNTRNESAHKLPRVTACANFKVINASKFRPFYGWDWFTKEYPDAIGLFKIGLPGYSEDKQIAIIRISESCFKGACNVTFYWILKRFHNKWIIVDHVPA